MASANHPQKSGATVTFGDGTDDIVFNCDAMGFYGAAAVARPDYTAWTGTATRTSVATGTATATQCAQAIKAIIDDLIAVGIFG